VYQFHHTRICDRSRIQIDAIRLQSRGPIALLWFPSKGKSKKIPIVGRNRQHKAGLPATDCSLDYASDNYHLLTGADWTNAQESGFTTNGPTAMAIAQ
ncbi:MAG: hypothetical protein KDJ67_13980, partial [Nitratireductor sp.]|nr:hypothetical protein [Nitratireductor sp.]